MAEATSPAPALWNSDYLDRCFDNHRVCISFGLWICACCCWIAAHALLLYLMCAKRSGQAQSALCAACCLLTSLCDTVGAILARQLTIQVFTGAYLAAVDLMNFVFILFPICGSKFKSTSGHSFQEGKRRQRLRASVFALVLPLSLGPCWALWAAVPKASGLVRGPQRRLLGSLLQDNTEVFGYLLGGIAAFGSWASRIPFLSRICRGKTFSPIHLWARLLSALAGLLYASAIVAHSREREYLLRATPWFLMSLGRAALDLAIIFLSWVMKSRMRGALGFTSEARESPDAQALLTGAEKEEDNEQNLDWVPLTTLPHCKPLRTTAAISRYMELTIEPVQQASCSATRLPGDGQMCSGVASLQEPPSYPPIQVIRARVSSSSSSEVPSINSDLESDCEGQMEVLVGLCKTPKGDTCRALETGLEVGFTTHSALLAVELGNTRSFGWTCSGSADSGSRENGETPPRPGCEGALTQQSTGHWAPEEISLEGNKDDVEMLRSQMHRCSMRPDDLTSDE